MRLRQLAADRSRRGRPASPAAPYLLLVSLLGLVGAASVATAGDERGLPWARHAIDDRGKGADGVRLADANGDGLLDVATGWEEAGEVRLYLNPGRDRARERWPAVTVGRVRSPEDAVLV
ncbi:MAG: hypothetical protein AB1689_20355, partial [Thermodesulfobacteriota bacterium]